MRVIVLAVLAIWHIVIYYDVILHVLSLIYSIIDSLNV
jgi:hypothetical protein